MHSHPLFSSLFLFDSLSLITATTTATTSALGSEKWELVQEDNVPFLIRETARKNQMTVSCLTVFKRL